MIDNKYKDLFRYDVNRSYKWSVNQWVGIVNGKWRTSDMWFFMRYYKIYNYEIEL